MRRRGAGLAFCAITGTLCVGTARAAVAAERPTAHFSVTGGVGNALGWVGVQGERYLRDGRLSVFVGVGYAPAFSDDPNLPTGIAAAAGCRAYFGGAKHRVFLEGSISQIKVEWWQYAGGSIEQARRYGPGLQAGYQLISGGGFTFVASAGVGYAVGANSERVGMLTGLSIGYTKRRG